jgi:hypothetical protein
MEHKNKHKNNRSLPYGVRSVLLCDPREPITAGADKLVAPFYSSSLLQGVPSLLSNRFASTSMWIIMDKNRNSRTMCDALLPEYRRSTEQGKGGDFKLLTGCQRAKT